MNEPQSDLKSSSDFPRRGDDPASASGANFTVARVGETAGLMRYGVDHPLGRKLWARSS